MVAGARTGGGMSKAGVAHTVLAEDPRPICVTRRLTRGERGGWMESFFPSPFTLHPSRAQPCQVFPDSFFPSGGVAFDNVMGRREAGRS